MQTLLDVWQWLLDNANLLNALATLAVTGALVFFTSRLVRVTHNLYRATQDVAKAATTNAKNQQSIDRTYVELSHTPTGMHPDATGVFHVRMRVRNKGRTPANITNVMVKPILRLNSEKLPAKPDYGNAQREQRQAFPLVEEKSFYFPESFSVPKEQLAEIQNGTRQLYLIGYVDYVDIFGNSHRAGYARRYDPDIAEGNNLTLVTEPGYNYDRRYRRRRKDQS